MNTGQRCNLYIYIYTSIVPVFNGNFVTIYCIIMLVLLLKSCRVIIHNIICIRHIGTLTCRILSIDTAFMYGRNKDFVGIRCDKFQCNGIIAIEQGYDR